MIDLFLIIGINFTVRYPWHLWSLCSFVYISSSVFRIIKILVDSYCKGIDQFAWRSSSLYLLSLRTWVCGLFGIFVRPALRILNEVLVIRSVFIR